MSVSVDGVNRTYVLHMPSSYDGTTSVPLVIDLHPLGGTGQSQMNSTGWESKSDSVGFLAAFPDSASNVIIKYTRHVQFQVTESSAYGPPSDISVVNSA
jgi:poly(3-hydroxybutyrate) depolymerase